MSELHPATLEGWFVLHQAFSTDWASLRALPPAERERIAVGATRLLESIERPEEGWSAAFRLVGGGADWMLVHFRPSLDSLSEVELRVRGSVLGEVMLPAFDYLSVTEAGLYHATAEIARAHERGSEGFENAVREAAERERGIPHVRSRLYPEIPEGMRYVSFYPMTKRRDVGANWYSLPIEERSRLMLEHGLTGRRYARRIFQVISGSVGLDDWEWGVTLFAADPLEFKRIVTEMRYDEASAIYGEFGEFFTGIRMQGTDWARLLAPDA